LAVVASAAVAVWFASAYPLVRAQSAGEHWVASWSTSEVGRPQNPPLPGPPGPPPFMANSCPAPPAPAVPAPTPPPGQTFGPQPFLHFTNQTLRQIVHASLGGSRVRVVLSNQYGTDALTVGAAHVALRDKDSSIQTASDRPLTFSGQSSTTIPPGAVMVSDAVNLNVPNMADLAVDIYLPGTTNNPSPLTMHNASFQTNYISESGNHVGKASLPVVGRTQSWFVLYRVEVAAPESVGTIVTWGDSITDGTRSTPDTNNRWPDHLTRRMLSQATPMRMGIANVGIAGNRVLSNAAFGVGINALARFEHNALEQPGVTHIVVLEGINDIGGGRQNPTPTAEDLIAAYKQLVERAHSRGIKIYGATLTPFWGAAYYTDVGEAKRQAVNEWIRNGKAYDGVIDFDKATRDPADPKKFLAAYDSCDHLHPNDAGYKAMAESIDLALFRTGAATTRTSSSR
jgi:lysophospholipase L1-like esterase